MPPLQVFVHAIHLKSIDAHNHIHFENLFQRFVVFQLTAN